MAVPDKPKIYHIVHVDRLASIVADGHLFCDASILKRAGPGTIIGMSSIKARRLNLPVDCRPGLYVGDCVPFYFCPRSIMLYLIYCANHEELTYRGGQGPIVHLECDFHEAVAWAERAGRRWAFTLSNAGAYYFEDRCAIADLAEVNWQAVMTNRWSGNGISRSVKEGKQAEFLMEKSFPWRLVERIGIHSLPLSQAVADAMRGAQHRPVVEIKRDWYY
jgi:hypothetical protein